MGRPRKPASEIADSFLLRKELGPSVGMALHKGKKVYYAYGGWQAERVILMNDEIEWRLFWKGHHVVQRLGEMTPEEMRDWLITEIDELFDE